MNCLNCSGPLLTARETVPYHLDLPYPIQLHDVTVHRCEGCGEYEVEVPRVEALHRQIALQVAHREGRLHPKEIRFLRKSLGWSGKEFAQHLQVQPETVSRWENGAKKMGERSELLLRMFVEMGDRLEAYVLNEEERLPEGLHFASDAEAGWSAAA